MNIKKDVIKYVANLARLNLKPEEEELFAKQLNDILSYIENLNKVNTDSVDPMSHAVSMGNVFRQDKVKDSLNTKDALNNAPDKKDGFFRVPKVIE
ncbi:Asp-tRNA(Asn)/Glu-tRNA(Gln) amidotransferase subunit GatC [Candidatus Omnitrophota bacterium]